MKRVTPLRRRFAVVLVTAVLVTIGARDAWAHCDTMDGPVVTAARRALETGDVDLVLVWVQPGDEAQVRQAFARARSARQSGGPAAASADRSFFETLVRIHRAGEGAPYTGVKPAGTDPGPAVSAADRSLESGSDAEVRQLLERSIEHGVERHFREALERRSYDPNDVTAGRAFVRAYVEYTHYVEGIHQAATANAAHHEHGERESHGDQHGAAHEAHAGHGGHAGHLPWVVAGFLGLTLIAQTVWLTARKPKTATRS